MSESRFIFALLVADSFTMPFGPSCTHFPDVSSLYHKFRDTIVDPKVVIANPNIQSTTCFDNF